MNIRKFVIACFCLSLALSIACYAEVNLDDYAYYTEDGSLMHDMDGYHYALAVDLVDHSGVDIDPMDYWLVDSSTGNNVGYDYDSFRADYDAAIAALSPEELTVVDDEYEPSEELTDEPLVDEAENPVLETVLESDTSDAVLEDDVAVSMQYVVNDLRVDKKSTLSVYPLRSLPNDPTEFDFRFIPVSNMTPSYDDLMECIVSVSFFVNGELFTEEIPISLIFSEPELFNVEITDQYISCDLFSVLYVDLSEMNFQSGFYFNVISFDQEILLCDPCFTFTIPNYDWYGGDLMVGTLKNLVVSIFGEYTPVNTTALLTETVDNVTTTTLIDVVAAGAAGVDWEWCAGVFLFGIMLFCLFKLLGGILS